MKSLRMLLSICLFALAAIGLASAQSRFPLTLTDAGNRPLTLTTAPARIVSLTLFSDEILHDMLPAGRMLAWSVYAKDRDYSNIASRMSAQGTYIDFNLEKLLSLQPDLILVADWSDPVKVQQARQLGLPIFQLTTPVTFKDVSKCIQLLGTLTGETTAASQLVKKMNDTLALIQQKIRTIPKDKRPSIADYSSFGTASGNATTWNNIVLAAGLHNAMADQEADRYGMVPLSRELLVVLDPDWLALPTYVHGDPNGAAVHKQTVLRDPGLQQLSAIRNRQIIMFPERYKSTCSHYLADAALYLSKAVYPTLWQ